LIQRGNPKEVSDMEIKKLAKIFKVKELVNLEPFHCDTLRLSLKKNLEMIPGQFA